ncbi:MAG: 50S ribosomal protein L25/general stress protein Ctc [Yaniella sp.]|uniref:50S ribosomal protein L25/general stress protein Ctc n=1 Tax=Yaniella sp. TaxID=2773929 RepID=UPI0017D27209|nr:50S ribosomal protein L25/general stress protein Ctc [Yaniella sp.]NLZ98845.1 50S ribosomal protein L25/general stress protein Ctc [Micrococcus sp.]MDN5704154.1 50S ribosomal protein L25/general stress protein Ctc [Yaniella sp.]MDN5730827.1 50S ribosomal protein L25/general stress protein Ctc [Yaniella sp.]MDN5742225.1 50S ribosomal protein L25/general stress protein Ctc [Yaniella sp.]MDN5814706.1 50S ribosomal protein L25/general stress protein Ctc [Yaniella sp.]
MALDILDLPVETRTDFGKGAARRARREGYIPAVVYGHGEEPRHLLLPRHEGFLALRNSNQLLRLVEGDSKEMALPKDIQRNPLKDEIKHVDLIIVRRGERVTVDVPLEVIGEVAPEHTYVLDVNSVPVEADALDLPDHVTIDLTDRKAGEHVYAPDVILPAGVQIDLDEEYLVATVDLVIEQDLGEDTDEEASGEVPTVAEENAEKE